MAGGALHVAAHRQLALVAQHRLQLGRLADQAQARARLAPLELGQHRPNAEATDLLVVGEGQMHGHREFVRALDEGRHGRQHRGEEALHVGRAAPIQLAVALAHAERLDAPGLAVHRHHVGMARQHHAAAIARADGGEQVRLAALVVVEQLALDAETRQVVADKLDQRQVRIAADRGEADQLPEQLAAAEAARRRGHGGGLTHRRARHSSAPRSG